MSSNASHSSFSVTLFSAVAPSLAVKSSRADIMQIVEQHAVHGHSELSLRAHPSLIAVAQRVIGGRTEPELNASSVPLENQLRLNDANGVVVEPGSNTGFCGRTGSGKSTT